MQVVTAAFATRDQAAKAIRALKHAGVMPRELSVVGHGDEANLSRLKQEEGVLGEAELRAGSYSAWWLGAGLGGFAGIVISSFAFLPALPLFMIGGAVLGAVVGKGIGRESIEKHIKDVKRLLQEGGAVVFVRSADPQHVEQAMSVLRSSEASDLSGPVSED